ncbi:hypothetical protein LRR18_17600, partial [Mangrovimonas sp. AS39]|uniref:hypothetical protein n=1 Tax=Mangrovimonas futianensis TaxID=2895523 RepID=UPI001E44CF0F
AYVIKQKGDPNSICITGAEDDWEEGRRISSITISFKESQDSSTYQSRLAKYEEDLAMYEFWYSRNKELADAAIAAKEEAKRLEEIRATQARIRSQEWAVT